MAFPYHPGDSDDSVSPSGPSGRTKTVIAVVVLALIGIVVLHLTGVVGG